MSAVELEGRGYHRRPGVGFTVTACARMGCSAVSLRSGRVMIQSARVVHREDSA